MTMNEQVGCAVDWSAVAGNWDRLREHVEAMKADLTRELLSELRLSAGDRVLELGAGTGELAARLAELVRPGGSVVASDLAPGMVELIRNRTHGIAEVDVAEIDATDIPLDDASVDAVVFRMGLMLVPQPLAALRECRRVLAPGGRLAVAAWGAPQDNPWMTAVGMAAMMHGLVSGGPPTGPGTPFSLADPVVVEKLLAEAGFVGSTVRPVDGVVTFADAAEHFDVVRCLAPPLAAALGAAPKEALDAVRRTVAELTSQYRDGGALRIPVRAVLGAAEA
jgi:ubiquinone/menaquinone biosynthesis C-methylase UbiE